MYEPPTPYQIVITDFKYLNRVNWQYLVLDEAQAIKSANSQRWKLLLEFKCRGRLLLSGTVLLTLPHPVLPRAADSDPHCFWKLDPDPYPHNSEKLDPDPHLCEKLDPDPTWI